MSDLVINASPTKEFFISIITKDISLLDAIKDLVDNSVDGARALRAGGSYRGLRVELTLSGSEFKIKDNCGGISVATATNYAFRFGRAKDAPTIEGSIGQFGVGMKRALFKIGKRFTVKSVAADSHFFLAVDVDKWTQLKDDQGQDKWELEFAESGQNESNLAEDLGTTLEVDALYPSISSEFGSDVFVQQLVSSLQQAHAHSLDRGLDIKVNSFELRHRIATLLQSDSLQPIKLQKSVSVSEGGAESTVRFTVYAGISESSFKEAGWYVICNGRQVLGADKTSLTGWDTELQGGLAQTTPSAHGQYARFRGYVLFESDNARVLPWNTSKSGVDAESKAYQLAKMEMVNALRQVIDFLNELDAERDSESDVLKSEIDKARPVPLSDLAVSSRFAAPPRVKNGASLPKMVRVQFSKPLSDVDFAKSHFGVASASKAGEAVFDYFIEREQDQGE